MKLVGGPLNGRVIEDLGKVVVRIGIAERYDKKGRPSRGANTGYAHYSPSQDRAFAYWTHDTWEGRCVGIYPQDKPIEKS